MTLYIKMDENWINIPQEEGRVIIAINMRLPDNPKPGDKATVEFETVKDDSLFVYPKEEVTITDAFLKEVDDG